mmetsp:Transcript_16335/g.39842  ORF Transcript_16335/g.39842 Transcript_16335/m.39842 type:complete len:242 (+) Transcript_16335:128-853(+)|eukprot:CAMPEP_0206224022 /NCGR_PEP_ID=MMETSP0047_2-20121206/6801_1 /ASSEMBLY_ACC=CAM_ASM_000192 /TAXON_ID=195065 /ORGANISM="Chroomonas mesostigmatica_cf, Strain CCMP1168" /LENGTH=241 /DNA_ID=CAMNT_0053646945 /DNA_START=111 /DNA_END=836 /DNA_ORIENTATION=-
MMHGGAHANPFSRPMNWNALGKNGEITPAVQKHLQKVYATLSTGILAIALGVYLDAKFGVSGVMTQIALMGAVIGLAFVQDVYNRLAVFHAAGLLMGCNMGPLVNHAIDFAPDIVITALMGTVTIFVCFSAAAMFAKRREFLYLGGMLGSAMSMLLMARFLNMIMGGALSAGLFAVELYGGLCMFMLYIVFDTQMIIEDAHNGRRDFVAHAMELMIDFVAVFVRLLLILMRNAEKKEKKKR